MRSPLDVFRSRPRRPREVEEEPTVSRGLPVFGCLFRVFLLFALLVLLALAALYVVAGGAVGSWVADVGQSTGVMGGVPEQTQRGIDAYRRGDRALAERELDQAARSYRRSAVALLYLARMRVEAGDLSAAAPYLDEAIAREPDSPTVRRMAGEYQLTVAQSLAATPIQADAATSHLELAEDHLAYAVSLDPADRRSRGYLGCVFTALGRVDEARAARASAGPGAWDSCMRTAVP
jgi:tetratricopeptide (TPR) repeat protein